MSIEGIQICGTCLGQGIIKQERCIDQHKRDYVRWLDPCNTCQGSGRVIMKVIREPYEPQKPITYKQAMGQED